MIAVGIDAMVNFFQCIFEVVLWLVGLGAGVRRTSKKLCYCLCLVLVGFFFLLWLVIFLRLVSCDRRRQLAMTVTSCVVRCKQERQTKLFNIVNENCNWVKENFPRYELYAVITRQRRWNECSTGNVIQVMRLF